jgi:tryptophanyl-tRNA synthetase
MTRGRVFSGIQPSGELHLGNYFGAISNWVELQDEWECIYSVVDYHAITGEIDPSTLPRRTLRLAGDLLACGIDPEKSVLFVQSHVPEHTELAWVLAAVAAYGDLTRMTQFKEKSSRSDLVNVGLFAYPVLQAADILLYLADAVPVGEDQSQHLELTRRIAHRFNQIVGQDVFPHVRTLLTEGKRIMSLADPTSKMSKSLGERHAVGLFEDPEAIARKVRSAVTDTGGTASDELSPGVANLIGLIRLSGGTETADRLTEQAKDGTLMYRDLKQETVEHLEQILLPLRERRAGLEDDHVRSVLADGARRARAIATETMAEVRGLVGVGAPALG